MVSASEKVIQLRQLLAGKFGSTSPSPEEVFSTELPVLDKVGVPRAAITEIVIPGASGFGLLLFCGLLHSLALRGERIAMVDGKDAFNPAGLSQNDLQRVLWTRCASAREALRAIDLVARDGNFPVVVALLNLNPPSELRRLPASAWHRLQMLAEKSGTALIVFTSFPQIGCSRLRLSVRGNLSLGHLHVPRLGLATRLSLQVERRRIERSGDEALRRAVCA